MQANERLATVYQRLAESEVSANKQESEALFERSDIAIEQLLAQHNVLTAYKRAEYYALKARNAKTLWLEAWRNVPEDERQSSAIASERLMAALESYEQGFLECLNHYYSGINTLGLTITAITLAERYPDVWELHFNTPELALQNYRN